MKTLQDNLIKLLEDFSDKIAELNLNWSEKFEGTIDYKEYVLPKEKEIIKNVADQILEITNRENLVAFNSKMVKDVGFMRDLKKEVLGHFRKDLIKRIEGAREVKYQDDVKANYACGCAESKLESPEDYRYLCPIHSKVIKLIKE